MNACFIKQAYNSYNLRSSILNQYSNLFHLQSKRTIYLCALYFVFAMNVVPLKLTQCDEQNQFDALSCLDTGWRSSALKDIDR